MLACGAVLSLFTPMIVRLVYGVTGYSLRGDVLEFFIAATLATYFMVHSFDPHSWSAIGLGATSAAPRKFMDGLVIGGGPIVVTCGLLFALGAVKIVARDSVQGWIGTQINLTIILIAGAISEELVCRGYLLTVLREEFGAKAAIVSTSVMFGLFHLANPDVTAASILVVMLAGIFLAAVRIAYESLYAAWMAHFVWNWVMAVPLHAPVSGIRFSAPGYEAIASGPAWLSGGSWGPEGGLMAAVGISCGLAYLYARRRREESQHG